MNISMFNPNTALAVPTSSNTYLCTNIVPTFVDRTQQAILEGRQQLPSDYWKEFARGPYFIIVGEGVHDGALFFRVSAGFHEHFHVACVHPVITVAPLESCECEDVQV